MEKKKENKIPTDVVHSSRWGIEPAGFDQKIVFTSVFKFPPHSFILWPRSFVLFHGLFLQFIAYSIPLRTSFVTLSYDGRDHAIKEFINLDRSSPLAHPFAYVLYCQPAPLSLYSTTTVIHHCMFIWVCIWFSNVWVGEYSVDFVVQKLTLMVLQMLLRQTAETAYLRYQISDWSSAHSMWIPYSVQVRLSHCLRCSFIKLHLVRVFFMW